MYVLASVYRLPLRSTGSSIWTDSCDYIYIYTYILHIYAHIYIYMYQLLTQPSTLTPKYVFS